MKLDRERVREGRERLALSMEDASAKARVSPHTWVRAEHGDEIRPSSARRIASALGVEPGQLLGESVLSGKAEAPGETGPSVSPSFDTPDKDVAREAIGTRMAEAGEPVQYLPLSQEKLLALYDDMETLEEAKLLAKAVYYERELLKKTLPNATLPGHPARVPGHPTTAIMATLATAAIGVRRVAERETARIRAEAEEAAKPLELAASGH